MRNFLPQIACGHICVPLSWLLIDRAQPTVGSVIPRQVVLGDILRIAECETGDKPIISLPPWSLLQSPPSGYDLSPCDGLWLGLEKQVKLFLPKLFWVTVFIAEIEKQSRQKWKRSGLGMGKQAKDEQRCPQTPGRKGCRAPQIIHICLPRQCPSQCAFKPRIIYPFTPV